MNNQAAIQDKLIAHPPIKITQFDPKDDDSKILSIDWYQYNPTKKAFFIIISAFLAFIPLLFLKWSDNLRRKYFYSKSYFKNATHAWIEGPSKAHDLAPILKITIAKPLGDLKIVYKIIYRYLPYIYNEEENTLEPLRFANGMSCLKFIENYNKCFDNLGEIQNQVQLFGKCQIESPMKTVLQIFVDELLNPFYLFQLFSVVLWFWDGYVYYSSVILGITVFSITFELIETKRNMTSIRNLARYHIDINTQRLNSFNILNSEQLVPGDIIEVPRGKMPCDCVLLNGSCVVNESVLTGESIPVIKAPLPLIDDVYDPDSFKKNTIFSGTTVIQTKSYQEKQKVLATVVRTGFSTTKGALVRSILFPKPSKFTFYADSMKFIAVLACFSLIGFFISLPTFIYMEMSVREIIDRSLDLITITVPPALPATLAIGTSFALHRLKKKTIYCISPPRVNVSGKVTTMVFDKTGTLTEEGLNMEGVHICRISKTRGAKFSRIKNSCDQIITQSMVSDHQCFLSRCKLNSVLCIEAMASCHSIESIIDPVSHKPTLIGDPLDLEMLEFTKWKFELPFPDQMDDIILAYVSPPVIIPLKSDKEDDDNNKPYQLGILRMFDFSAKLKRMSVITKNLKSDETRLFCKGAPEILKDLCIKETIPENFVATLNHYAEKGCRVIGLATKRIKKNYKQIQAMKREQAEMKLNFLGLMVMHNKLKDVTVNTIKELREADINCVMATGDNILTAISVGKECNIISSIDMFLGEIENKRLRWTLHEADDNNNKIDQSLDLVSNASSEVEVNEEQYQDEEDIAEPRKSICEGGGDEEPWKHYIKPFEIALTGEALDYIVCSGMSEAEKKKIILKTKIYARMSPDNKAYLVEKIQEHQGTIVGMCGDGANDCAALKAADVGVSLSEAEASIAAPFTSKVQDISCIPQVLKEGRAALVTSFQCFKYMALYSMIQFCSVVLLYLQKTNLSDMMYLAIDLFIIIPFAATMSWSDASKKLTKQTPTDTLISFSVLTSVIGQIFLQITIQLLIVSLVREEGWFTPLKWVKNASHEDYNEQKICIESTTLFMITIVEYSSCVIAFTKGAPYRAPIWENKSFLINVFLVMALAAYIIIYPAKWVNSLINVI